MPEPEQSGLSLKWEVVAIWFGRLLFMVGIWQVNQLLVKVDELASAQMNQTQALLSMQKELQTKTSLRWTQVDQKLWATLLAQQNPAIIVPEPRHVSLDGSVIQ